MTHNGSQNFLIHVTQSTCSTNSSCHFRGEQLVQVTKQVAAFEAKLELWGQQLNIDIFDVFQTLGETE